MSNKRAIDRVTKRILRGAGGDDDSSSSPRIPIEASDTIQTKAFVRVVDLISEGEIVGLVNGNKSIFLDETPLQNEDGSYNFSGVSVASRVGTQDQSHIDGFDGVENEISLNVPLKNAEPVIREINNPNIDRLKVRIQLSGLQRTDVSTGDVSGATVRFTLWIQPNGGSYTKVADRTISGKSSGRFEIQLSTSLEGEAPWNFKVVRETAESDSAYVSDDATVASYTEVIDSKLRYPNSAIVAMRLNAEQFASVPSRYYHMRGLKIRIPANYDPETRSYSGSWDGSFQTAWSDNPAWCFYDLLTSDRYGLGAFIAEENIDKWALYEIAQYCDELVPDGFGGMEPRFTCNLLLQSRQEAYTVLQNLASIFRGMIYWAGGLVSVSQDSPSDPVALYAPANVIDGLFVYQGASSKARHTVALVAWNDPEDFYRQKVEYVEDRAGILAYGINETELVAFGCTSRGQAHRLGKWLLYTEQNESETVTFKAALDSINCRPGQIIQVADPTRAGVRMGGRVMNGSTASTILLDQAPATAIIGGRLYLMLPDGSTDSRIVDSVSGNSVHVAEAFDAAPARGAMWILRSSAVEPQTFRVLSIKEDEGNFEITALATNSQKFDHVEQGIQLEARSYSILREAPDAPTNLTASEALYQSGSTVKVKVSVAWERVFGAVSYIAKYRRGEDNWISLPETPNTEFELPDALPGNYTFQVVAINALGKRSVPASLTKEIFGKTLPPGPVLNFSMIPVAGNAQLTWAQSADLDVLVGGAVRIRWTPLTSSQQWSDAIDIDDGIPGNATSAQVPLLSGTYMAKFIDSSGNYSEAEALVITTVPAALALNVVETIEEDPGFTGAKDGVDYSEEEQAIHLGSRLTIDEIDDIDAMEEGIDFAGGVEPFGVYDFAETFDLGGVFTSNLTAHIEIEAFDISEVIDLRYDNIDDWDDIDGDAINDVRVELYMRSTEDDPSGSPTWSEWKRFVAAEYMARAFQFKLNMYSDSPMHNAYVRALSVRVDMDDRTVDLRGQVSGTDPSYHVSYPEPFREAPAVTITANAMATGDYYEITGEDETGFDIVFKNSGGSVVSRTFNVIAKGYGRKVA